MKQARKEANVARENFKMGNFYGSIEIYTKWINRLENLRVSCYEDDEQRHQYLVKLYQNISLSYNKATRPKRALIMIREMEKLTDIKSNPVMLFAKGKAKMLVGDYNAARKYFRMASLLSPDDKMFSEINNELNQLQKITLLYDAEMEKNRQLDHQYQKLNN